MCPIEAFVTVDMPSVVWWEQTGAGRWVGQLKVLFVTLPVPNNVQALAFQLFYVLFYSAPAGLRRCFINEISSTNLLRLKKHLKQASTGPVDN